MFMNSIATVSTAPEATNLTTLDRVKLELGIENTDNDDLLEAKIAEASADIEASIGRTVCRAGITETFWPVTGGNLILDRYPVASIESVTVDDVLVTEWRLDTQTGILYRLDESGYQLSWYAAKSIIVVYTAGYIMPGETDRDLPYALEGAAIELVSSYWQARGRDASLKAEEIPDVIRREYWVGQVGSEGELPPSVVTKIAPYRRAQV